MAIDLFAFFALFQTNTNTYGVVLWIITFSYNKISWIVIDPTNPL